MRKRLLLMLGTVIPFGLAPAAALAEGCGDYPLTEAQSTYLEAQVPYVKVPEGNVPFVQRCDVDGNNVIDNNDLFAIREHRGQPATHPDDPMDWDGDGVIHGRDVGGCASSCNSNANGCAVKDVVEEEGLQSAEEMGQTDLPGNPASCYQVSDFDGDDKQDFMGIYEYEGTETRGNNWDLQVVILTQDEVGNVQHVEFQYTGQVTDGNTDLRQHLSLQLPGTIDLDPGSITIDEPAVVSYRDGEPEVIYYFTNGTLNRAFYRIND